MSDAAEAVPIADEDSDLDRKGRPAKRPGKGHQDSLPNTRRAEEPGITESLFTTARGHAAGDHAAPKQHPHGGHCQVGGAPGGEDRLLGTQGGCHREPRRKWRTCSTRLLRLEEGSTAAPSESASLDQARRRMTLVLGGFPRNTKRVTIPEVVESMTTTCARSATSAPSPPRLDVHVRLRPGEAPGDAKQRWHAVLSGVIRAKIPIKGMLKPMWAGISKSKEERLRSSHCGLTCATAILPEVDSWKIHTAPKERGHAWVNVSVLAKGLGVPFERVEAALKAALL